MKLRYYLAFNGGLQVLESMSGGGAQSVWEGFYGRTVEHLTGSRRNPHIVFAAVALDGGYRTLDGGRSSGEGAGRGCAYFHHRPER